MASMLSDMERAFVAASPVARLATADASAIPHVLPICFVVIDATLYFTIDQKPKSGAARSLKRLQNIAANPAAAVVIDRYDDDWEKLAWVMLRGTAEIIDTGPEHALAQKALIARYPQYRAMHLAALPVVALRITRVSSWGQLATAPEPPLAG